MRTFMTFICGTHEHGMCILRPHSDQQKHCVKKQHRFILFQGGRCVGKAVLLPQRPSAQSCPSKSCSWLNLCTLQCNIVQLYWAENLEACAVAWIAVLIVAFCTNYKSLWGSFVSLGCRNTVSLSWPLFISHALSCSTLPWMNINCCKVFFGL